MNADVARDVVVSGDAIAYSATMFASPSRSGRDLAAFGLALAVLAACADAATPDAGVTVDAAARADATVAADAGEVTDLGSAPDAAASDAGFTSAPLTTFCAPLAEGLCARADTCGCGAVLPGGTFDVAGCRAAYQSKCEAQFGQLVQASGSIVDGDAARDCAATVLAATSTCGNPSAVALFARCTPWFVHPAQLGEACAAPFCAGGLGTCADGVCVARAGLGEGCMREQSCARGLVCVESTCRALGAVGAACTTELECGPPLTCVAGFCAAPGAEGARCADASACAPGLACEDGLCRARTACADGACGFGSVCGGARTCSARGREDAPCTDDRQCAPELYCADDVRRCVRRPGATEACARGVVCAPGLGCRPDDSTCAPAPGRGEPCAFSERGPLVCAAALACIDGNCGPIPTEGQACAIDNICADGLGCDFSPEGSFCITPRDVGGRCESDRSCRAELHCGGGGTCVADLPAGQPCAVGNECAGICGRAASGMLVCLDRPKLGDACLFDDDCPATAACLTAEPTCVAPVCRAL